MKHMIFLIDLIYSILHRVLYLIRDIVVELVHMLFIVPKQPLIHDNLLCHFTNKEMSLPQRTKKSIKEFEEQALHKLELKEQNNEWFDNIHEKHKITNRFHLEVGFFFIPLSSL
jgi:hypothetical protein